MSPAAIRSSQRGELPVLELAGPHGRLVAALHGAHVLDWQPDGARPVLFVGPRSHFQAGKAIRGGVPLCFPWFGPKPDDRAAPAHGFARLLEWNVQVAEITRDGSARLVFGLVSSPHMRAQWPHEFSARMIVRANRRLDLALEIVNTGPAPLTFAAALHTYLAVSDVRQIAVRGLEDTEYLDRAGGGSIRCRQDREPIRFAGEVDRTYVGTTAACTVDDPGWKRRIHVAKSGSRSTVVWNPWTEKARALTDLGEDAWPGFVCVETCNVADDAVTLAPGATHTLAAEIGIEPMA